ncbi:MAG: hypothetical protein FK733_02450 [Asgard group archaeon]|nr:hypothetical protein [Asgard group archaeon]
MAEPTEGTKQLINQANAIVEMADWENIKYKSVSSIALRVSGEHEIPSANVTLEWSVSLVFEVEIEKEKRTITKPV